MDTLSKLLHLMPVSGTVDTRCHFSPPWRLDYAATGPREIPYHILLRGTAQVEDGRNPIRQMTAGDILLIPSGVPHALFEGDEPHLERNKDYRERGLRVKTNGSKSDPVNMLCGRFILPCVPRQMIKDNLPSQLIISSLAGSPPDQSVEASIAGSRLARLVTLMHEEALEHGPGSESMMNHMSGALFGMTLRVASSGTEPPVGLLRLARRPKLQPAFIAMVESPEKPWTLSALASLCLMSRATFTRQFEEAIGRSPSELLTEIRMALASRKLAQTTASTAEIAQEVGYQSDAAFQRTFKKHVGLTPSKWRTQSSCLGDPDLIKIRALDDLPLY